MEIETATTDPISNAQPRINSYHCLCTTLLLVTTHDLNSLSRRAEPALDRALILPLPAASKLAGEENESGEGTQTGDGIDVGYSLLLSTTQDRKPTIVRREDGFEKRTLLRCGRCRLVVGYKLDPAHFGAGKATMAGLDQGEGDAEVGRMTGNADEAVEVVYLLPGGLVSSEELKSGKTPEVVEWKDWGST